MVRWVFIVGDSQAELRKEESVRIYAAPQTTGYLTNYTLKLANYKKKIKYLQLKPDQEDRNASKAADTEKFHLRPRVVEKNWRDSWYTLPLMSSVQSMRRCSAQAFIDVYGC